MSLRKRTFLTVGAVLFVFLVSAFAMLWFVMIGQFDRVEEDLVRQGIARANLAIENELGSVAAVARDWSAWDESCKFVDGEHPTYSEDNLTDEAVATLRVNFLVYLDPSKRVVAAKHVNFETGEEASQPEGFIEWITGLQMPDREKLDIVKGLSVGPKGPTFVVLAPIISSAYEGPSHGTLVAGRYLTNDEVSRIEHLTYVGIQIKDAGARDLSPEMADILPVLHTADVSVIRALDSHYIAGYTLLHDINGRPSILFRALLPRDMREFRERMWLLIVTVSVIIGLTVTALAMGVLERRVLARLVTLSREVSTIAKEQMPSARVAVDADRDELTALSTEVNGMLAALEHSNDKLKASEAIARALLDAPDDPSVLLAPDGRILGLNRKAASELGGTVAELTGKEVPDNISRETRSMWKAMLNRVVETKRPWSSESQLGERTYIQNLYPVMDATGEVAQVAVFARDITEQRLAAAHLEQSQQRYRNFVENSHGIAFQARPDGTLALCHGNVEQITGYSEKEFMSNAVYWQKLIYPEDAPAVHQSWKELFDAPGTSTQKRYRIVRKDGKVRWVEEFGQSVAGPDGQGEFIQGVVYDITRRVIGEQALRDSLQTTSDIVRAIPSGLVTFRYERPDRFYVQDCNPEAERLTGVRLEHCRGRELSELWPELKTALSVKVLRMVKMTGRVFETEEFQHRDKRVCWAFRIRVFRLPGDKLAVAFEDTLERKQAEADRKRLEEQLHHSQKMEAIGQLAGGVAHDFNNLLGGILGYASLLKLEAGSSPSVYDAAQTIEQAAERAADLTRQLLGFARRGKFQNVTVNLHDTVQEVIRLLGRTIDKNIRIVQSMNAMCPNVLGDPNQLQQVFVNLAINARDAMPNGGDLTFESRFMEPQDVPPELFPETHGLPMVAISVTDQGYGIPPENIGRIFEPFFTTKEQGKGTGMGLAMVYGIVKNHGGVVRVYSQPGLGTTFRVYLPASLSPMQSDAAPEAPEKPVTGSAHILLVDDEAVIREMGRSVLGRLGYTVSTASDGAEAVEYYRENAEKVDLVILDMVMPEMGGHECFRAMKQINPGLRSILSSGYGFNGKASELLDEGMLGFIQKPYCVSELSVAVARALTLGAG